MAKSDRDFENTVLTLRLNALQAERYWQVMDAAKNRNPYIGRSDVMRELLGLTPPSGITEDEIKFFRSGNRQRSIEKTQQNAQPGRNLVPQGAPLAPNSLNKIKMGNPQGVATKKKKGVA